MKGILAYKASCAKETRIKKLLSLIKAAKKEKETLVKDLGKI